MSGRLGPFRRPQLCLFGDSITQFSMGAGGWGSALASDYQRHADVLLRGYSGYNSRWALQLLPDLFPSSASPSETPALVTVFLGANAANRPPPLLLQPLSASRQHVPLQEYESNLAAIVRVIRQMGDGSAKVLIITPPPVDHEAWHAHCVRSYGSDPDADPNRHFDVTAEYAKAAVSVGKATSTPVADVHSAIMAHRDWKAMFDDGLHPNPRGNAVIFEQVKKAIAEHFPELVPQNPQMPAAGDVSLTNRGVSGLMMDFPDHKAIDAVDPGSTFAEWKMCLKAPE